MKRLDYAALAFVVYMDARPNLKALEKTLAEDEKELAELLNVAEDELTDEDEARIEELTDSVEKARKRIKALRVSDSAGRPTTGKPTRRRGDDEEDETEDARPKARRSLVIPANAKSEADKRTHGFMSFGAFAASVGKAYKEHDESAINHLTNAATTYGTESVGGDGGWLVPPDFGTSIWTKVNGEGSLAELCAPYETSRNALAFPKDETTPWDNSTGIKVFWEGEGEVATESKAKFEIETARLKKLMALVKVSEELLDDAVGLDSYLRSVTPIRMQARLNTAIVRGTGAGMPLGILNAPSLLTISKETSQDAATIIMPNINKMWERLYAPSRANAVWLINQECEHMLDGMAFIPSAVAPGGNPANMTAFLPIYMPANSISNSPYALLKGRPVMPMMPCSQLGTVGDIILVDLKQYMLLRKAQSAGIQVDTSIHLHFDQAVDTYRFMFRVQGQPIWNKVISAENGSNTYSWATTMETRS